MKIVREHIFEEEDYKPKWIKGPTQEQVRARLEANLSGKTLKERFNLAVRNGVVWLLQECIDAGYDPSAYENWAIRLAADHGHPEVVKVLLADPRVDPSAGDNYAIRLASENGHLDVVKALLADKRVDPSAGDNHAISWALNSNYLEVVKELSKDKRVRMKLTTKLKERIDDILNRKI